MNNSYITIIKEKRTALSRKRVPLNQNECTDDFRIGVPFEQNLHHTSVTTTEIYSKANPEVKRKHIEDASRIRDISLDYSTEEKEELLEWLKNSI